MKQRDALLTLILLVTGSLAHVGSGVKLGHHKRHAVEPAIKREFLPYAGPSVINTKSKKGPLASSVLANTHSDFVEGALTQGRYGHNAVYLPSQKRILFIGGQVGNKGMHITNDVVALDLDRPAPCAENPASDSSLSTKLPPHAWAAAGVDDRDQVWLIGGVTQDCNTDPLALTFNPKTACWETASALPHAPPRRRQASAMPRESPKGNGTLNMYIWGGIAEPYTCSAQTVGYMGMDIWGTAPHGSVETIKYTHPLHAHSTYEPPVSDYAVVPEVLGQVVIVGGQQANGKLASMRRILVFHSLTNEWEVKNVVGDNYPSPRMGHVAFRISDTQLLIHGGVGHDNIPSSDMWLLDGAPNGKWEWSKPAIDKHSMAPPRRAWHSATWINDKLIVIAYGIDTESTTSSGDIFFLTRLDDNSWVWSHRWDPHHQESEHKPHATASAAAVPTMPPAVGSNTSMTTSYTPTDTSIQWAANAASASPLWAGVSDSGADDSTQGGSTVKAVAGTIGGIAGAVALAGLIGVYLRRRSNAARHGGVGGSGNHPPVSGLHFTRPAPHRVLSLGQGMQQREAALASRPLPPSQTRKTVDQSDLMDYLYPSSRSIKSSASSIRSMNVAEDPFIDPPHEPETPSVAGASVTSYPFLKAIPMSGERTRSSISAASTVQANQSARAALGHGRPSILIEGEDAYTRLPNHERQRTSSAPRIPSMTPASPMVIDPAGLLRITNPPSMMPRPMPEY